MNLSSLFGFYQNPSAVSSGSANGVGTASPTAPQANLGNLQSGQTFQGEVVAVKGNEVVLSLENGSQLSARLDQNMQVGVGQTLTFEVKSNTGARLALSPLFENMGQDPNVQKALRAAGMPASAQNVQMVSLLMREGMPVNRGTLHEFGRQMALNPTASPETLAQMNRLQIPATPENIAQFEAYKNYEHQISSSIMEITDGLTDTFSQMMKSGDVGGAANLFKQVLTLFTEEGLARPEQAVNGENAAGTAVNAGSAVGQAQTSGEASALTAGALPLEATIKDAGAAELLAALKGQAAGETAAGAAGLNALAAAGGSGEGAALLSALMANVNGSPQDAAALSALLTGGPEAMPEKGALTGQSAVEGQPPEAQVAQNKVLLEMAPENREQLANVLREAGFSEQLTARVSAGSLTQTALLTEMAQEINSRPQDFDSRNLARVFDSREFNTALKNEINRQWLLKPEEVAQERQVEELYRRLNEQTTKLTDALSRAVRPDAPVAQAVNNLSNNINFINQLNQMFTYIQLPLKMSGENTHGELYVYTNKKNLAKEDGNVSALLHLDMDHLGPVDVYVAMQNQNVSTKFYLQDDSIIDLIANHIHILDDRLNRRGYSMNCEFIPREAEKTPMEEMLEANKNVSVLASYSFDARA